MTPPLLQRLRRMTANELCWRTRQQARMHLQRIAIHVRQPRWERTDIREVLADGVIDYMFRGRTPAWADVHAELVLHFHERHSRFALDPASADQMRQQILAFRPRAAEDAAARADRIVAHRHNLLGYTDLECGDEAGNIAWHSDPVHRRTAPMHFWADVPYLDPAVGDHKIIWELNRHQHWLQLGRAYWLTGDVRYADAILTELDQWLAANPPLVGINWSSMLELGFRAMSWTWAMHFLLAFTSEPDALTSLQDRPWLVDMLVGLHHQLTHVERNLSLYFSPNTHLTGEALALYVVGVSIPELAGSPRWAELGREILMTEISRQIARDGGHLERSTHYQRYTLDFYLMALLTARRDGDTEAAAAFSKAATRLADFTRAIADDEGRLVPIGDDDGGMLWPVAGRACHDVRDSLALAAVLLKRPDFAPWGIQEETFWVAGPHADPQFDPLTTESRARSRTFPDTGYIVVRNAEGTHAVIDVGRHGYLNGGHAHADPLAFTLKLNGRPLLIDPGTSTYTMNPKLRDQLRTSMSHNTVSLQGRSAGEPAGPFHWKSRADAELHASRHNELFDWIEASHHAYAPLRHRRSFIRVGHTGWLIVDEILGEGPVTASAHWHFDPLWTVTVDGPGRLRATMDDAPNAAPVWLLHEANVLLARGDGDSNLGWYAPIYGTLTPTWTARTTISGTAPLTLATWISEAADASVPPPSLERIAVTQDREPSAIGIRIRSQSGTSVHLLRPGSATLSDRDCAIADFQTDARIFHYAARGDHLMSFGLVDASHALALRDGWVSIAANEPIAELSGVIDAGRLDLFATLPPPQIRLHGRALQPLSQVRLNGRALCPLETLYPDTLVVEKADWGSSVHDLLVSDPKARRMDVVAG